MLAAPTRVKYYDDWTPSNTYCDRTEDGEVLGRTLRAHVKSRDGSIGSVPVGRIGSGDGWNGFDSGPSDELRPLTSVSDLLARLLGVSGDWEPKEVSRPSPRQLPRCEFHTAVRDGEGEFKKTLMDVLDQIDPHKPRQVPRDPQPNLPRAPPRKEDNKDKSSASFRPPSLPRKKDPERDMYLMHRVYIGDNMTYADSYLTYLD